MHHTLGRSMEQTMRQWLQGQQTRPHCRRRCCGHDCCEAPCTVHHGVVAWTMNQCTHDVACLTVFGGQVSYTHWMQCCRVTSGTWPLLLRGCLAAGRCP